MNNLASSLKNKKDKMKNLLLTFSLLGTSFLFAQNEASFVSNASFSNFGGSVISSSEEVKTEANEVKKITYQDHLHAAESFNIPLIMNNEHMDSLILANKLIPVAEEGEGYKVQKLTHSRPFLNQTSYLILKEISSLFYKETNQELSISSLTRTIESQNRLRRVNSNAAKGHSAHSYGASFDISYSKFGDKVGRNSALERVVENILQQLEAEGKIYYIKERRQPCFHVTIRNTAV